MSLKIIEKHIETYSNIIDQNKQQKKTFEKQIKTETAALKAFEKMAKISTAITAIALIGIATVLVAGTPFLIIPLFAGVCTATISAVYFKCSALKQSQKLEKLNNEMVELDNDIFNKTTSIDLLKTHKQKKCSLLALIPVQEPDPMITTNALYTNPLVSEQPLDPIQDSTTMPSNINKQNSPQQKPAPQQKPKAAPQLPPRPFQPMAFR